MPTKTEQHMLIGACEEMYAEQKQRGDTDPNAKTNDEDGDTMFIVISSITGDDIYGPFHSYARALEFARDVDGSIFRLVEADGGER